MNEQDTKLLISTLKEVLNLRIGYLHGQHQIDDPHDDPTGLCVNLSYLIHKIEGGEHATCVHCDESHHVDDDHQCKEGE